VREIQILRTGLTVGSIVEIEAIHRETFLSQDWFLLLSFAEMNRQKIK
jgi:hypothetical protein